MREGFYYFAKTGTPFYPGLHNLGSRDWTAGEQHTEPILGEYSGERQWVRGDPPARRTLPVLVGDPDCIANGERAGLPIVIDQSADCGKISPPPCYGPEDDLLADTNVLDCVFAKKSADIISAAYTDLPLAVAKANILLGPDATVSSFSQPSATIPAGVIGQVGATAVVWITGTTNFQQLVVQAFYFATGPINQGLYSASALYEAAANAIAAEINAAGAGTATRIVLAGHSYGGAVAMVLAAKMLIANPGRRVELLTVGAPAPGDKRLVDLIDALRQTHYADERDPIPFMPPRGLTFAALVVIIGPLLALLWPTFVRPPRVRTITEDGRLVDELTEDLPDDLIYITSLAIAAGLSVPNFQNHRAEWYAYWLCNACKCVARPCVEPPVVDVEFEVQLTTFEYVFLGVTYIQNLPSTPMTVSVFYPSGKPRIWQTAAPGVERITIEGFIDLVENYTGFRVNYSPDPLNPLFTCYWDFTAGEMSGGLMTSALPSFFESPLPGDGPVSLGSLFIMTTFV